jgi:hypothetical protein
MPKTNKIARYVKVTASLQGVPTVDAKPKPTGLYLLELRSRLADAQAALPKRKLVVKIETVVKASLSPKPVKITRA